MNSKNNNCLSTPIIPKRVRSIDGKGFAFIPHRFLQDGFLSSLDNYELALYLFLVLAANKHGVSFYGYESICSALKIPVVQYLQARNSLINKNLIAFDGTRFQVLSLPQKPQSKHPKPLTSTDDFEKHDIATIRTILSEQFGPYRDNDK